MTHKSFRRMHSTTQDHTKRPLSERGIPDLLALCIESIYIDVNDASLGVDQRSFQTHMACRDAATVAVAAKSVRPVPANAAQARGNWPHIVGDECAARFICAAALLCMRCCADVH